MFLCSLLVHCRHPWSCHPGSNLEWKASSHEDELCHHSHVTWHKTPTSCICFHNSSCYQACYSPWSSQVHQVHWWLDQGVPRSIHGHWQIPWWIQDPTPSWCPSCDTHPQEMPHCLAPKGQGTPQQNGKPGSDHPCRWTHGLGILHYLCSERQMASSACAWIPVTSTRPSAEIITKLPLWRKLLTSLCTLTSSPSWMSTMDTGQSSSTRSPACLWLLTDPLEDMVSCDFPSAWSVPKTSSRRRWIRSSKSAQDA